MSTLTLARNAPVLLAKNGPDRTGNGAPDPLRPFR